MDFPVVDVHCHFFNAADVPVEGFVRYVMLGEQEPEFVSARNGPAYLKLLNAFIVFLVVLLSGAAPSAKEEILILNRATDRPTRAEIERRKRRQLQEAVLKLDQLVRGGRSTQEFTTLRFAVPPNYEGLLAEFSASTGLARRGASMTEGEADTIATVLLNRGELQRYIAFAMLMLDYRETLAREYIRIFASNRYVSLVTPSILDFEKWLPGEVSQQSDQIDVMDAVQAHIARSTGIHMHSFVGFDPRREVQEPGTSLALVKRAILEHGFVGVKLYPPMGFQASDNKGPIETALRRLYDWCKDADVPIMAHAENSIGAGCGYGKKANPVFWRRLLSTNDYDNMRINLAHFGGFDEVMRPGEVASSQSSCEEDKFSGPSWESIIGKTIDSDKRSNLFADLSYFSELVSPEVTETYRKEIRRQLGKWIRQYDRNAAHLMFGTDWSMMALETNYNNYIPRISEQLTLADVGPDQQQNIFWKNAARYLGLARRGQSRDRLAAYCRNCGLDSAWLSAFDTA
ncbi:amidohydrolase family protein [Allomesorhizobium camelthorni]|uniref:Amidohydrolase family protein n=1 Tax=Allomesorhizobium camelthorni TaxID=475069 RepID=A0A6G4WFS7_9HYPH|nr:amidohydrolase family protein [Mesorhizobium camelthorni]NGO52957.1 amidohydrolase family protein [Mesorhizobium camelthorni]